jgi:hypothetical protein
MKSMCGLVLLVIGLSLGTQASATEQYTVRTTSQFATLMQKLSGQHGAELKQFLAQLDPATQQLSPAQVQQYCQLMQARLDDYYLAYDANRQLFEGRGGQLDKRDFIVKAQSDLTTQALKDQGLSCIYH